MREMMCAVLGLLLLAGATARAEVPGRVAATSFAIAEGFYVDQGKWLGVHPDKAKSGVASVVFPFRDGVYDVTLEMVGENDGQSTFEVFVEQQKLGKLTCPASKEMFEVGPDFSKGWKKVEIRDGDIVKVKGTIASADGQEWSRARWAAMVFTPVDGGAPLPVKAVTPPKKKGPKKSLPALHGKRQPDGIGGVEISGELKKWHNVVLTLDGPFAHELDNAPNPFVDREMNVVFSHESGEPTYTVPGYFAADGNAGESSAECGTKWRAHLSPDKPGKWTYVIDFKGTAFDGNVGGFTIAESDKTARDYRGKGRLHYVGKRYLQFADSKEWFLKAGADAPETLLGYADFDNTVAMKKTVPLKTWKAHSKDWKPGDPTWKDGKGKGLIGAVNYLADKDVNAFSFLTYNAGGDGDNVWPHVSRDDKLHFDCSKLDQWGIVFNHGTAKGMYLHFKLQETENDDLRSKGNKGPGQALDAGKFGAARKAYLREMIARYGHNLALNWNLGEENTQTLDELEPMISYVRETDPYAHNLVLHTYPNAQDKVYGWFLGRTNMLSGLSIQNSDVARTHTDTLKWVTRSEASGHPWVVAFDEAGNAQVGTPPDPDWPGVQEARKKIKAGKRKVKAPTIHDIRAQVLWGTLMAGGTGVEYYFGYQLPENDLLAENWRSREKTWNYSRIALNFFKDHKVPFVEMQNANALIGNEKNDNRGYCLAKKDAYYLVYLRAVKEASLDLSKASGSFSVVWFNPRKGGALVEGTVKSVQGGAVVSLGAPPADADQDWVAVVKK